ncbi:NBR1-Ig-like domain-containing protein [Micromonospora sp. NPDC051543]|uniref:NBR1-Ig-like domain-containing protein n=1 Tax=Micromonospora sp. NPDC051543 TaxID=3364287 RepID=UPI00378CEF60
MRDQRAGESSPDGRPAQRFAEQLRTLRSAAGDPSFRKMAGRSGRISHTTLHEAAAGTRFPSWETTREFVRACEADEALWRGRWEEAQRPVTAARPSGDGDPAPVVAASAPEEQGVVRVVEHPGAEDRVATTRRRRLPWLNIAAVVLVLVVAVAAVLGATVRGRSGADGSSAPTVSPSPTASPSATAFSDSLIPGDSSRFVADVTIPDGTQVKVNAQFDKVWALANVGKVDWHNRYLARMDPAADGAGCRTPDRVPIGDTPPGEQVMIRVRVTAPSRPGRCWVSWKMVDEAGREYFPTRRPVYFMVTVTA